MNSTYLKLRRFGLIVRVGIVESNGIEVNKERRKKETGKKRKRKERGRKEEQSFALSARQSLLRAV
jgi:hypothetical protein